MHDIVFLDRDSLIATIRPPAFAHRWQDYPATAPHQVVERGCRTPAIAITTRWCCAAPRSPACRT
jgi:glycerate dehydrogenase